MANLLATKQRLSSASTTQKVIKAMELVASSKIKKAKDNANNVNYYFEMTTTAASKLFSNKQAQSMLKLDKKENNQLIIVITSDMGLCGAYNTNVLKEALNVIKECSNPLIIAVGLKAISKIEHEKIEIYKKITNLSDYDDKTLSGLLLTQVNELFCKDKINDVKIIYTDYINPLVQEVRIYNLFEFKLDETKISKSISIEPNEEIVFETLISNYIRCVIYSALLKSVASEHSYRRNSMEAANKNSLELIDDLNLELNRIRQAMITQEISEIIGGSEALK